MASSQYDQDLWAEGAFLEDIDCGFIDEAIGWVDGAFLDDMDLNCLDGLQTDDAVHDQAFINDLDNSFCMDEPDMDTPILDEAFLDDSDQNIMEEPESADCCGGTPSVLEQVKYLIIFY